MLITERNKKLQSSSFLHSKQIQQKNSSFSTSAIEQKRIIPDISNLKAYCLNPVKLSFGRKKAEHESWGAVHNNQTGETSFKLFSFPDAKEVKVLVSRSDQPIGLNQEPENCKSYKMTPPDVSEANPQRDPHSPGVYTVNVSEGIKPGDQYCFEITKNDNQKLRAPDPYSMKQPGVSTWSVLTDEPYKNEIDFEWQKNPARIVRNERVEQAIDGKNIKFTPWSAANIYEAHIGTMTEEGTFDAAIKPDNTGKSPVQKLKEKGFNAIEILPLENTHSFNWGYDGVNKFAARNDYGGRDGFKKFLKHCHDNDMSVIVDFVPNHIGPNGNYLSAAGKYTNGSGGWGDNFYLEGGDNRFIKDYVANMALNWLRMGADGIRADMTEKMGSNDAANLEMKEIAAEVNHHFPDAFLIAEDSRPAGNITTPLNQGYKNQNETRHDELVEEIMRGDTAQDELGFDSKWGFEFHHNLAAAVIGGWKDHKSNIQNLFGAINNSAGSQLVKYPMSHDEIGNHEGTRIIAKVITQRLDLGENVKGDFNKPYRIYQLGGLLGHRLAVAYATMDKQGMTPVKVKGKEQKISMWKDNGELSEEFKQKVTKEMFEKVFYLDEGKNAETLGLEHIRKNTFEDAFNRGVKLSFVATGVTFATPGPNMFLQGDENLDLTPFRFFREFENDPEDIGPKSEKGYDTGVNSFIDSKLSTLKDKYSPEYKARMNGAEKYFRKLSEIFRDNKALQDGYVMENWNTARVNDESKVIAIQAKRGDNEIFSVANFSERDFTKKNSDKYGMAFPKGRWELIISSDDPQYGGEGKIESRNITVQANSDNEMKDIEIPAHSFMMFKKTA